MAPDLPWRKKSHSHRARKSENKAAKLEGGRRSPMSGAGRVKGDVQTSNWLIEDKTTEAVSYRLELDKLVTTHRQAIAAHRLFQWRITIRGETFRLIREDDYLAMVKNDEVSPMPEEN